MKKKKEEVSLTSSFTEASSTTSQPVSISGHKRSKSFVDSKSFSPNLHTPDMVVDAESATSNNVSKFYYLNKPICFKL